MFSQPTDNKSKHPIMLGEGLLLAKTFSNLEKESEWSKITKHENYKGKAIKEVMSSHIRQIKEIEQQEQK